MMKQFTKIFIVALFFMAFLFGKQTKVHAAELDENISVTMTSNVDIVLREDGTNTISDFIIRNDSQLPIKVLNVIVSEYNGWKLVSKGTPIPVNQKKIALELGEQQLFSGHNDMPVTVPEHSEKVLPISVERGAWDKSHSLEKAFSLDVEYEFGTKEFQITFDGNGSEEEIASMKVENGTGVTLPKPVRKKYEFKGWKDPDGNVYNEALTMPASDVSLTAEWVWAEAYAIYSSTDKSLTFIRSSSPIVAGSVYQGKTVTNVYTGFEEDEYKSYTQMPWLYAGGIFGSDIKTVVVQDYIQPKSTAYWFFCMRTIETFDLGNLDMSQVSTMISMFSSTSEDITDTVTVKGIGQWDTSNIKLMGTSFRCFATNAKELVMDDISHWDTSAATDMLYMFVDAAPNSNWSLDCSNWNVQNVTVHDGFNLRVEHKVKAPKWVH